MKTPARTAVVVLGICILGCVIGFALWSGEGNGDADLPLGGTAVGRPNQKDVLGEPTDDSANPMEDETTGKTKVKERPDAAELASKRLERRREELLETLEEYKRAGLGGSHPQVVKTTEALSKIEAEEAAAGEKSSD